jgi:hypothetical protein
MNDIKLFYAAEQQCGTSNLAWFGLRGKSFLQMRVEDVVGRNVANDSVR